MKTDSLASVSRSVAACTHCATRFAETHTRHTPQPIFQVSGTARLCIAGQAPGLRAHKAGKTFADPSGVRLREWLGIGEEVFYDSHRLAIVPMAFCFPGYDDKNHDLPPPADCARLWRRKVFAVLPRIELIITVGKAALGWHSPEMKKTRMGDAVAGGVIEGPPSLFPLPHPSWRNNRWLKENPWFEAETLPVLRAEVARLTAC